MDRVIDSGPGFCVSEWNVKRAMDAFTGDRMAQTDPTQTLTEAEARVLFTVLQNTWAPMFGYAEFRSAVVKLGKLGGGFCCRDCSALATIPHRLGGFVCEAHKPAHYPDDLDELSHLRRAV